MNGFKHAPIVAALLLTLSACGGGGGGGSDTAVSNSGNAAASTSGSNEATTGNSATTDGAGSTGASTDTPATTGGTAGGGTANASGTTNAGPISATGVRGDVLLTGLSQMPCTMVALATAIDGPRITDATAEAIPTIGQGHYLDPSNYVDKTSYEPIVTSPMGDNACLSKSFRVPAAGSYKLNVYSNPLYSTSHSATQGFHNHHATFALSVTADGFSLGDSATVNDTEDKGRAYRRTHGSTGPAPDVTMRADKALTLRNDTHYDYDTLRMQWTLGNQTVQMLTLPDTSAPNRFRLCWNADMNFTKRLQCTIWQVPDGWSLGQELTVVDQYLTDDRSTYAADIKDTEAFRHFHASF